MNLLLYDTIFAIVNQEGKKREIRREYFLTILFENTGKEYVYFFRCIFSNSFIAFIYLNKSEKRRE